MQALAKILVVISILLLTTPAIGQDIHYSQYFNNPLSLNPAESGNFDGDWRAIANYRDQWSSLGVPYKTFSASYDQQLNYRNQRFSPGLSVFRDNSANQLLVTTMVYASCGYHRIINKNIISLGLQVGYVNKKIDFSKLTFSDQYDISTNFYNPEINSSVTGQDNVSYLDINFGGAWKRKIKRYEPEVGFSFFHLNNPKESFFDDKDARKPIRSAFYASVRSELNQNIFVKPGVMLFSINGSHDMMVGSQFGVIIPGNTFNVREAYGGVYLRNGIFNSADAIMLLAGAQINNLNVNISYDVNISSLSNYTNHRGAFEISIIYKSISAIIKTFTIPCERI